VRNHPGRKLRLRGKADTWRMCRFEAPRIIRPALRQIERAVHEGMTVARHIGREYPDLAIRDLPGRTGVLSRHSAGRLALLEIAGLVDDQHCVFVTEVLDHIIAHQIAQLVCVPAVSAQKLLLAPRAGIARRFRPHPASLAPFFAQQSVHERARARRRTFLRKQRTHPSLHVPQRRPETPDPVQVTYSRRPQRQYARWNIDLSKS
jgi:hypothetical protein